MPLPQATSRGQGPENFKPTANSRVNKTWSNAKVAPGLVTSLPLRRENRSSNHYTEKRSDQAPGQVDQANSSNPRQQPRKSLYERLMQLQKERDARVEEMRVAKLLKEEEETAASKRPRSRHSSIDSLPTQDVYSRLMELKQKRDARVEQMRKEKFDKECPFTPNLVTRTANRRATASVPSNTRTTVATVAVGKNSTNVRPSSQSAEHSMTVFDRLYRNAHTKPGNDDDQGDYEVPQGQYLAPPQQQQSIQTPTKMRAGKKSSSPRSVAFII